MKSKTEQRHACICASRRMRDCMTSIARILPQRKTSFLVSHSLWHCVGSHQWKLRYKHSQHVPFLIKAAQKNSETCKKPGFYVRGRCDLQGLQRLGCTCSGHSATLRRAFLSQTQQDMQRIVPKEKNSGANPINQRRKSEFPRMHFQLAAQYSFHCHLHALRSFLARLERGRRLASSYWA